MGDRSCSDENVSDRGKNDERQESKREPKLGEEDGETDSRQDEWVGKDGKTASRQYEHHGQVGRMVTQNGWVRQTVVEGEVQQHNGSVFN